MPDDFVIEAEAGWVKTTTEIVVRIVARVKDQNGEPVKGLKKSNFRVVDHIQAATPMSIVNFTDIGVTTGGELLHGTYQFYLDEPYLGDLQGQLVFALRVKKTPRATGQFVVTKVGQTLITMVKL